MSKFGINWVHKYCFIFQVCLSYFAPGLSHNHVHFVLPSALAVLSRKLLNPDGVLYKVLYQHFRFTERINYQVSCCYIITSVSVLVVTIELHIFETAQPLETQCSEGK